MNPEEIDRIIEKENLLMLRSKHKSDFEFYFDKDKTYYYHFHEKKETLFTSVAFASFEECKERLKLLVTTSPDNIRQKFRVTKTKQCVFILRTKNLTLGISTPFNDVMECRLTLRRVLKKLFVS